MANAQDWQKQQIARNQYLQNMAARMMLGPEAQGAAQGTDWGGIAGGVGGILSALAMAGMAFSDEETKCIVPSGEQCKRALAAGDPALVLKQGQVLGMFPEGKRSQGKGLSVAKTGTARMAIEAQCPIVPITVVGSDKFFKQFPHRAEVHVTLLRRYSHSTMKHRWQ